MIKIFTVIFSLVLLISSAAVATTINELEVGGTATNNSTGTAQAIPGGAFTTPVPATVFNPPGFPTATVIGQGGSPDVDFYSFTASGGQIYIDIDNDPFTFDTIVSLFNSAGTLLASNDDSGPIDSGSASGTDSFLGVFTLPGPGTYFIAVSEFDNFASATSGCSGSTILLRPDGNFGGQVVTDCQVGNSSFPTNGPEPINGLGYTMHVSVQSPVSLVPEPASLLLVGSGLLLALWRRKRN